MKSSGNWVDKLEKKMGKYAISNLMKYMVVLYVIGYLLSAISPAAFYLDFDRIFKGEIWRLVTFVMTPPSLFGGGAANVILAMITNYVYYMIGSTLEMIWGSFRFNLFYFGGVFSCIICALITTFLFGGVYGSFVTTEYIFLSMFLAYAMMFPNQEFLLFFLLPVKAKWFGVVYVGMLAFKFFECINIIVRIGIHPQAVVVMMNIVFSVLNFIILFSAFKNRGVSHAQKKRTSAYKKKVSTLAKNRVHTCTMCGRTSQTNPELEFRFCSRCDGNREYCTEHLFTHEHINKIVINIDKNQL